MSAGGTEYTEGGEMMKWLGSLYCQESVQGKETSKLIENNSKQNMCDIDLKGRWFDKRLLQKRIRAGRKEKNKK